jgi:phage-related protein
VGLNYPSLGIPTPQTFGQVWLLVVERDEQALFGAIRRGRVLQSKGITHSQPATSTRVSSRRERSRADPGGMPTTPANSDRRCSYHRRRRLMARLQAVFYRARDRSEPVDEFIEALGDPDRQAAIDFQIDRLNMLTPANPHLPFPHSSQVEGELRELRCHYGRELYRILYRRSRNLIVLLHMFRKDTGTLPQREIEIARRRWADFKERMDADKRRPPRAAGHDAP